MFEDSLIESSRRLAARHPWTTAVSFVCQSILISALLLFSLLYTESLPTQHWIDVLQAPPPLPAAAPQHEVTTATAARVSNNTDVLTVPLRIPTHVAIVHDEALAPSDTVGVSGVFPGGVQNGISDSVLEAMKPVAALPPKPRVQQLRVSSGVALGMLVHQVKPEYPATAVRRASKDACCCRR